MTQFIRFLLLLSTAKLLPSLALTSTSSVCISRLGSGFTMVMPRAESVTISPFLAVMVLTGT